MGDGQAPSWMLETPRQSLATARVGASPTRGSGMHTVLFFALIIGFVAAAGILGVVFWGPDKTVASRQHLATDPQPAQSLPSLSASAASADAPPPAATEPPPSDSAGPGKKGKKLKGKKGH